MKKKSIPDITLPSTRNKNINLKKDFTDKILIVYFYPKDATPGCTQEGQDFTHLYKKIQKQGGEVIGVSKDSISSHEKFKEKQKYSFDLLSDVEGDLCKAFGVIKEKSMFGKKYLGIDRSTFVISPQKTILKEWRNVKVKGHAQEVLDFIQTL